MLEDASFGTILIAVVRKITEQAEAISDQRSIFRKVPEKASNNTQERRAGIDQEVLGALPYAQSGHITDFLCHRHARNNTTASQL